MRLLAVAGLTLLGVGAVGAAEIKYHYIPANPCGTTSLKPSGPDGALGTRVVWFGLYREPYNAPVRATHMVTFRHPYTNREVTIPLAFPEGTPRVEYRRDRIVFNYGSYTVEARFLSDGSVDAVYNSGPFRGF
jgi:hypothetical protein